MLEPDSWKEVAAKKDLRVVLEDVAFRKSFGVPIVGSFSVPIVGLILIWG